MWGFNYYPQYFNHSGCIVWDKLTTGPLSDCEIAWQSINKLVIKYTHAWTGFNKGGDKSIRIHPNQKPTKLYKWILKNYAKPDFKIIDTHAGSGSSIISFLDFGCDWIGFEIDKDPHKSATERIENHKKQLKLF